MLEEGEFLPTLSRALNTFPIGDATPWVVFQIGCDSGPKVNSNESNALCNSLQVCVNLQGSRRDFRD